jgi:cytochrome c-type biogenesis protein
VVASTSAFVAGFTAVFVAFGIGAAFLGGVLLENRRPLEIAAGVFVILAAITFVGLPLPRLFAAERRLQLRQGPGGLVTAGLAGAAFGTGWIPCVGPTLAAILTLSAGQGGAVEGAALLTAYSLGLGVPMLLFGLVFTRSLGLAHALRRHWRAVNVGSAVLLVVLGALLITGDLVQLTTRLARFAGWQI